MYSEADKIQNTARIRKNIILTAIVFVAMIGVYALLIVKRLELPATVMLCATWCALVFMIGYCVLPVVRYGFFLRDMRDGLTRDVRGTILEVCEGVQDQDGVRVREVRIELDPDVVSASKDELDKERLLYINDSKLESLPECGAHVLLHCFGRHIKAAEAC